MCASLSIPLRDASHQRKAPPGSVTPMSSTAGTPEGPARSTAGRLLVAPPALRDPNFTETVVLMLTHNDEGAFGLVLNRVSQMAVHSILPAWEDRCSAPTRVFGGGPVQLNAAVGLVRVTAATEGVALARTPAWPPASKTLGDLGTVDLDRDPALIPTIANLRIFAGYSGWGAGQLDGEIEMGGWIVVDARPDDPFDPDPLNLWARVLSRQGGLLGSLARTPDPAWN